MSSSSAVPVPSVARPSVRPRPSIRAEVVRWFVGGLPAIPIAILSHELAHFAAYKAFGLPGVQMHAASVSRADWEQWWQLVRAGQHAAAHALTPYWQMAVATGAGLAVSYLTIAACAIAARRRRPGPVLVGIGIAAGIRFLFGIPIAARLARGELMPSGTDEGVFAAVTGVPELALWIAGLTSAAVGWTLLARAVPGPGAARAGRLVATLAGGATGMILYLQFIGPRLLP